MVCLIYPPITFRVKLTSFYFKFKVFLQEHVNGKGGISCFPPNMTCGYWTVNHKVNITNNQKQSKYLI